MSVLLSKKSAITVPLMLSLVLVVGTSNTARAQAEAPAKAKAKAKAAEAKGAAKLDLNKATAEELAETLPGVGPVTARRIVEGRPYEKVEDLARAGVPARTIEAIRPLVTVS